MATIYRLLTEDDTSAFCHKVSLALSRGWALHGSPSIAFDSARGVIGWQPFGRDRLEPGRAVAIERRAALFLAA